MDVFAETNDGEFAIPMLRELATATKFEDGAITTSGADYILKSDPDEPGMLLIEKVDRTDNDCSVRSEEHTSELQSLMRISYAVFCLKKKKTNNHNHHIY